MPSRPAELGPPILCDVSRSRALTGHRAAGAGSAEYRLLRGGRVWCVRPDV